MIRECFPVRGKLKIIPGSGKCLHRPGNMRKQAPRLGNGEGTHNSHSKGRAAGERYCGRRFKAAKCLEHTQKLLFCLEDNRDVDTKEYWEDVNFLGGVKGGTE